MSSIKRAWFSICINHHEQKVILLPRVAREEEQSHHAGTSISVCSSRVWGMSNKKCKAQTMTFSTDQQSTMIMRKGLELGLLEKDILTMESGKRDVQIDSKFNPSLAITTTRSETKYMVLCRATSRGACLLKAKHIQSHRTELMSQVISFACMTLFSSKHRCYIGSPKAESALKYKVFILGSGLSQESTRC